MNGDAGLAAGQVGVPSCAHTHITSRQDLNNPNPSCGSTFSQSLSTPGPHTGTAAHHLLASRNHDTANSTANLPTREDLPAVGELSSS